MKGTNFLRYLLRTDESPESGGVCKKCGTVLDPDDKFCPRCGYAEPEKEEIPEWDCECNNRGLTSEFCPECGKHCPEPPETWDCACGNKDIASEYCPICGKSKPIETVKWKCEICDRDQIPKAFNNCPQCGAARGAKKHVRVTVKKWDCPDCGEKGKDLTTPFCPYCGKASPPPPKTWNCPCGEKNLTFDFCPQCGGKRTWDCPDCGKKDISTAHCPDCGHAKV